MDFDGFKAPKLPGGPSPSSSSHKRKAADELPSNKGKQRATVTVADDDEDDEEQEDSRHRTTMSDSQQQIDDEHDQEYNRFAPPGADGDYFAEEDEDGRFFGGGLSTTQKQILDIFDEGEEGQPRDDVDPTRMTVQSVRRQLLNLERAINKNSEMRIKWSGQPDKFVDSEVTLDGAIQELLLLTQNPKAYYPEVIKFGIVNSLADLLSHENVDISLTVIQVLEELTDDDVLEGGEDEDEDEEDDSDDKRASTSTSARQAVVNFASGLLSAQVAELLVNNLGRLNEEEEQERSGVYHSLSLIENLLSLQPSLREALAKKTTFISWLLKRLQPPIKKEKDKREDDALAQNRQYAAELLSILLQGGEESRTVRIAFGKNAGMEICLKVLSVYRKRDPAGAEETEYMENVFDCICSAVAEPENKALFLQEEGVELMVIMMKEKLLARNRAIKALDHALTGDAGTAACEHFVEALGLKSLFTAFMNKDAEKEKKKRNHHGLSAEDEEHILAILAALLSNLESDSIPRIRVLKKFIEDDYAKLDRLLSLRTILVNRIQKREKELAAERDDLEIQGLELDDVEIYLNRLEAGLLSLQLADYVLAWVCMEDDGAREHAKQTLAERKASFTDVVAVLEEYRDNIGDSGPTESVEQSAEKVSNGRLDDASNKRNIVDHLIAYLQGV